jgi:hypothetical protein
MTSHWLWLCLSNTITTQTVTLQHIVAMLYLNDTSHYFKTFEMESTPLLRH